MNALTGSVHHRRASKITLGFLVAFYQALYRTYPDAERIYVIQDNWPVHTHPDLLVALESQETRWPWYRPPNWPTEPSAAAIRRWGALKLPIQIVPLPTYASWCNPIEKLWRKPRQDVTHLHIEQIVGQGGTDQVLAQGGNEPVANGGGGHGRSSSGQGEGVQIDDGFGL